jgi:hypothetical protein
LPKSILLPTTRKGRGPPKDEPHLRHAVSLRHSLNQSVHLLQLGLSGRHFPPKVPYFGPQGRDLIGLTLPRHHRLPPSPTLLRPEMPQQCGFGEAEEILQFAAKRLKWADSSAHSSGVIMAGQTVRGIRAGKR